MFGRQAVVWLIKLVGVEPVLAKSSSHPGQDALCQKCDKLLSHGANQKVTWTAQLQLMPGSL